MRAKRLSRLATSTVLVSAAMIAAAQPASAAEVELDAGVGCEFRLGLDGGAPPPERREFTDRNGNDITVLAGKSGALTWTNLDNHESISFASRGTRLKVTGTNSTRSRRPDLYLQLST